VDAVPLARRDLVDAVTDLAALGRLGVVPVVTIDRAAAAVDLAAALTAGGLPCVEITLRTPAAIAAIEAIRDGFPDLLLGAGTVLDVERARTAVDAGATFLVAPGFDEAVVEWAIDHDVLLLPGVMTPTEMMRARRAGLRAVKFFPAGAAGGPAALRACAAVFDDLSFVPTGGIEASGLPDYLALPSVIACGGSWMATSAMVAERDWDAVEQAAAGAVAAVRRARGAQRA
jgi:2-dehydro-3-deoxyphosphogluconate aldolase/(4S)-4-hydroxy-2-oxoglutarate aldolase